MTNKVMNSCIRHSWSSAGRNIGCPLCDAEKVSKAMRSGGATLKQVGENLKRAKEIFFKKDSEFSYGTEELKVTSEIDPNHDVELQIKIEKLYHYRQQLNENPQIMLSDRSALEHVHSMLYIDCDLNIVRINPEDVQEMLDQGLKEVMKELGVKG